MKYPTVALVGRPNVGKSTLFNKLVGTKISIIEDYPGVTRDRIYGEVKYRDYHFSLIDTGGIDVSHELFQNEIKVQVEIAIEESDVVVFVVDGKEGLTANDKEVSSMLFRSGKRVIVAINKVDSKQSNHHLYDFYELGFSEYIPISAEHNNGIYELLDAIVRDFPTDEKQEEDTRIKFYLPLSIKSLEEIAKICEAYVNNVHSIKMLADVKNFLDGKSNNDRTYNKKPSASDIHEVAIKYSNLMEQE